MHDAFPPSYEAAKQRLANFIERAGQHYTRSRSFISPPGDNATTSCLSPYIGRRLLPEWQIVHAVLQAHGTVAAEKFIQEICWRTYWKGWLELRPRVWQDYLKWRSDDQQHVAESTELKQRLEQALSAQTGIDCFDCWVRELVTNGYLHNHARMWFASIWIFTLKLPWTLGADFFYRNLLDADAASNTLSWRWVAGLHTKGKPYVARADNICKYTQGQFNPCGQLNENPDPLEERYPSPALVSTVSSQPFRPPDNAAYLATMENLAFPSLADNRPRAILMPHYVDINFSAKVQHFNQAILRDTSERYHAPLISVEDVADWAHGHAVQDLIMPRLLVGPLAHLNQALDEQLHQKDIRCHQPWQEWDRQLFPLATRGYFPFTKKLKSKMLEKLIFAIAHSWHA